MEALKKGSNNMSSARDNKTPANGRHEHQHHRHSSHHEHKRSSSSETDLSVAHQIPPVDVMNGKVRVKSKFKDKAKQFGSTMSKLGDIFKADAHQSAEKQHKEKSVKETETAEEKAERKRVKAAKNKEKVSHKKYGSIYEETPKNVDAEALHEEFPIDDGWNEFISKDFNVDTQLAEMLKNALAEFSTKPNIDVNEIKPALVTAVLSPPPPSYLPPPPPEPVIATPVSERIPNAPLTPNSAAVKVREVMNEPKPIQHERIRPVGSFLKLKSQAEKVRINEVSEKPINLNSRDSNEDIVFLNLPPKLEIPLVSPISETKPLLAKEDPTPRGYTREEANALERLTDATNRLEALVLVDQSKALQHKQLVKSFRDLHQNVNEAINLQTRNVQITNDPTISAKGIKIAKDATSLIGHIISSDKDTVKRHNDVFRNEHATTGLEKFKKIAKTIAAAVFGLLVGVAVGFGIGFACGGPKGAVVGAVIGSVAGAVLVGSVVGHSLFKPKPFEGSAEVIVERTAAYTRN